jgi:hypothetical protein
MTWRGRAANPDVLASRESVVSVMAPMIAATDFDDVENMLVRGEEVLRYAAKAERLEALLAHVLSNPALVAKCERFNLMEKIVLYEEPTRKVRLRLHVFGHETREMHHHRASFVSLILHGSYRHLLFGDEQCVPGPAEAAPYFRPLLAQEQRPGAAYALHHAMMHSTLARPETVSLMLQAPAARASFRIYDMETGRRRDRVGTESGAPAQEEGESGIPVERLFEIGASLREWGLI